jgi:hypothetical protein
MSPNSATRIGANLDEVRRSYWVRRSPGDLSGHRNRVRLVATSRPQPMASSTLLTVQVVPSRIPTDFQHLPVCKSHLHQAGDACVSRIGTVFIDEFMTSSVVRAQLGCLEVSIRQCPSRHYTLVLARPWYWLNLAADTRAFPSNRAQQCHRASPRWLSRSARPGPPERSTFLPKTLPISPRADRPGFGPNTINHCKVVIFGGGIPISVDGVGSIA